MYKLLVFTLIVTGCKTYDSTSAVDRITIPSVYKSNFVEVPGVYHPLDLVSLGTWNIETTEEPISGIDYVIFKFNKDSLCYGDSVIRAFQMNDPFCCFDTVAVFDNFKYKGYYFMARYGITPDSSMIPLMNHFSKMIQKNKIQKINCP